MSWNVQTLYCLHLGLLCTCAAFVDDAICTKKKLQNLFCLRYFPWIN